MKYLPNQVFRKFNGAVEIVITRIEEEDIYLSRRHSRDLSDSLVLFSEPNDGAYTNCCMISDCTNAVDLRILLASHLMRQVKDAAIATEIVKTHLVLWKEHRIRAATCLDSMSRMVDDVSLAWGSSMIYPVPDQIMFCCNCDYRWNPLMSGRGNRCPRPGCGSPDIDGFSENWEPTPGEFQGTLAALKSAAVGAWSDEDGTYIWKTKEAEIS